MTKEYYFCRIKDDSGLRWCVECCEGRHCPNLGDLQDNTRGCLGYGMNIKEAKKAEGVSQPGFCKDFYCWEGRIIDGVKLDTPKALEETYELIKNRPPGEFKMDSDIVYPMLKKIKNFAVKP